MVDDISDFLFASIYNTGRVTVKTSKKRCEGRQTERDRQTETLTERESDREREREREIAAV